MAAEWSVLLLAGGEVSKYGQISFLQNALCLFALIKLTEQDTCFEADHGHLFPFFLDRTLGRLPSPCCCCMRCYSLADGLPLKLWSKGTTEMLILPPKKPPINSAPFSYQILDSHR